MTFEELKAKYDNLMSAYKHTHQMGKDELRSYLSARLSVETTKFEELRTKIEQGADIKDYADFMFNMLDDILHILRKERCA